MNKVKAVVVEVLGDPEYKYENWFLPVKYTSYGRESETELMFDTKIQAKNVEEGYEFLT